MQASRRSEILDAARRRFLRQGFRKTSIGDIASDVGLVKSALYKYFSNKDSIFAAVVEDASSRYWEGIESRMVPNHSASDLLRAIGEYSLDHFVTLATSHDMTPLAWNELRPIRQPLAAPYKERLIARVERLIRQGIDAGDFVCAHPRQTAMLFRLGLESIVEWVVLRQMTLQEARETLDVLLDTMMNGLLRRR